MAYDFMESFDKNNTRFKAEISKHIDENIRKEGYIVLGETPPVLGLAGANTKLPLVINNRAIDHIIDIHLNTEKERSKISYENIINMNEYLINPICLIHGDKKDTIMAILDITSKYGDNLAIPIEINKRDSSNIVNIINTEYPRENTIEYIIKETLKHNLIAYHNKKLENLLRPIGLLLPVEHTNISSNKSIIQLIKNVNSYDDNIIHNLDNIKYREINNLENRYFKFNTDNKFFKPTFRANYLELNNACKELGWGDALQYFTEGEKLSKERDGEYLWKIEMFKYDKDRGQLQNKLIELKTKEIEEKLKEIKSMLKVKEEKNVLEISIDWENAKDSDSFNSLVVKELKNRNIEYAYDHFFKLRAEKYDLKVNVHTKVEDRTEYIESFETIKNKEKETKQHEEFRDKYSHIIGDAPLDLKNNKREVSNMLKEKEQNEKKYVKDFIKNNISDYLNNNNFKDAVTLDQKIVSQFEYLKDHFGSQIRGEKGVGYHAAQAAALGLFIDDPTAEKEFYPKLKDEGEAFEQYCKDCSIVFNEMYEESVMSLYRIREEIRDEVKEFVEKNGKGNTYNEKFLDCYSYYKNVFEQNHEPNVNGNVGAYIAQDGNLSVYHDDIRKLYGMKIPNKATDQYHNENQVLWEIYKKDVNEIFESELKRCLNNSIPLKTLKELAEESIKNQISDDEEARKILSKAQKEKSDNTKGISEKENAKNVKDNKEDSSNDGRD